MKRIASRLALPACLIVAGCVEAPAPASPFAPPPRAAQPPASSVEDAHTTEAPAAAPAMPAATPTSTAEETDAQAAAYQRGLDDAREFEEFRVCHVVMSLGHPDLALRFMDLYERHHRVRERALWEALRVRVLFRLGRAQEAEAGAKMWEGTEVGRAILQQIRFERLWEERARKPKK